MDLPLKYVQNYILILQNFAHLDDILKKSTCKFNFLNCPNKYAMFFDFVPLCLSWCFLFSHVRAKKKPVALFTDIFR